MKWRISTFIAVFVVATARCQAPGQGPLVAFSSENAIVVISKTGKATSTIKLPIRVGEFSFSPDLKTLVVVSPHPDESGGKMYLYSLASKRLQGIPAKTLLPKSATPEVYSEPQFTEDGTKLLFNAHPQAEGDLYETSGSIGELDLKSFHARALEFTDGLITDGMLLSPNGREFLLWDEGKVIDANDGTTLFDFHDFQLEGPFKWALDEAWIGNSCVLYEAGKSASPRTKGGISYFVLDLKSLKSTPTIKALGLSDKDLDGLVSYRYPYAIVKSTPDSAGNRGQEYYLVSPGAVRTGVAPGRASLVQLLPSTLAGDLDAECN